MAVFETWIESDLQKMIVPRALPGNAFCMDSGANLIGVSVMDGGEPATLSGTVAGKVVRSDGTTVPVTGGTLSGNKASIILPQRAYEVPGPIAIAVTLTSGSTVTTIGAVTGYVVRSQTDSIIDPGTILPTIDTLINQIQTAIDSIPADYSQVIHSIAPSFSSSTAYSAGDMVWYPGEATNPGALYRFTSAHAAGEWTGTDATAAVFANELSALKSALTAVTGDVSNTYTVVESKYIATNGILSWLNPGESNRTVCVEAKPNKKYVVKKNTATIMHVGVGASGSLPVNTRLVNYSGHSSPSSEPLYIETTRGNTFIYIQLFADSDSSALKTIEANISSLVVLEDIAEEIDDVDSAIDKTNDIIGDLVNFNNITGYTSKEYNFVAGKTYVVEIVSGYARVFTRKTPNGESIDEPINVATYAPYKTEFTASEDAYYARFACETGYSCEFNIYLKESITDSIATLEDDVALNTNDIDNAETEIGKIKANFGNDYGIELFTANKAFDIGNVGSDVSITPSSSGVGNSAYALPVYAGEMVFITAKAYSARGTVGVAFEDAQSQTGYKLTDKYDIADNLIVGIQSDGYVLITTYPEWFGYVKAVMPTLTNGITKSIYSPYPQLPADGSEDADFDSDNMTAQDIYNYIDAIVAKYPNMSKRELLGKDTTNTYDIYRYIIGDRTKTDYLGTIFIGANEHGPSSDPRECAIVVARLIDDLCGGKAKTNDILNIIKAYFRVVIIPVANPYGFNKTDGTGRNNGNNVNINRNYNTPGWSSQSDTDKGASAGSEVETQYIMQTIDDFDAKIALDLHCLGYNNASNDNKCHYSGKIYNKDEISRIAKSMKRDYNLDCTSYGAGNYNVSADGDSYFNYKGIHGLLLEFQAREGATSDPNAKLHSANIIEANYTFMLRILNMLISDYNPAYSVDMFR